MSLCYLNGNFLPIEKAAISPLDRGFLFGDGVYEVIPVYNGKVFRLKSHIARLNRSLQAIDIKLDLNLAFWQNICQELGKNNSADYFSIYLQVTRGVYPKRNHKITDGYAPTVFATTFDFNPSSIEEKAKGFKAITCDDIRWQRCDIKSTSLLGNVLAYNLAQKNDVAESILIRNGYVTEASTANVFVVNDYVVKTSPKSNALLGGITREVIIEILQKHGLPFEEGEISEQELISSDEIWITSTTREILPIIEINNKKVGNGIVGPVWYETIKLFKDYIASL